MKSGKIYFVDLKFLKALFRGPVAQLVERSDGHRIDKGFMKGFIYILRSFKNNRYYIGSTNNLTRRIKEHIQGKNRFTQKYS